MYLWCNSNERISRLKYLDFNNIPGKDFSIAVSFRETSSEIKVTSGSRNGKAEPEAATHGCSGK